MTKEHDNRYKKLFSNPSAIKKLLLSFVDEDWVKNLDYDTLERLDKSFVTEEFINRESDIIYRINFKGEEIFIYLLIEFQSTVDKFMALRMLRYITEFYEYLVSVKKIKKLPPVFPVMLYNGERKWTAPAELGNLIDRVIPEKYIPSFSYYRIAENEFSKEMLLGIKNIISAIFYIENTSPEDISEELDRIISLIKKEKPEEVHLFRKWIKNFLNNEDPDISDEVQSGIREIEEVRDMLSTALKKRDKMQFEQGIKE